VRGFLGTVSQAPDLGSKNRRFPAGDLDFLDQHNERRHGVDHRWCHSAVSADLQPIGVKSRNPAVAEVAVRSEVLRPLFSGFPPIVF
jgi:hypothetical protein